MNEQTSDSAAELFQDNANEDEDEGMIWRSSLLHGGSLLVSCSKSIDDEEIQDAVDLFALIIKGLRRHVAKRDSLVVELAGDFCPTCNFPKRDIDERP